MVSRIFFDSSAIQPVQQIGNGLEAGVAAARRIAHALQPPVQDQRHLLRHLRRKLPHLRQPLHGDHFMFFAQVVEHLRRLARIQVRQHQSDGLRMLGVEQLAQLLRIGALQLGQIALRRLLRAPHQRHHVFGALFAEGLDQHAAGVIHASVHHEILCIEKLPELLQHLGRELRRDAAQVGQFLGDLLDIRLGQSTQNLLGQLLAHGNQQNGGFAYPG